MINTFNLVELNELFKKNGWCQISQEGGFVYFRNVIIIHGLLPSKNNRPKGMSFGILAEKADVLG